MFGNYAREIVFELLNFHYSGSLPPRRAPKGSTGS
jgi:hypothetical protein